MSQVCQYEFRHTVEGYPIADLKQTLRQLASQWVFQIEKGDSGYVHYQGKLSLKKKRRPCELKSVWDGFYESQDVRFPYPMHCQPVVTANKGDSFYVTKLDTRVEGPYSDKDVELYIPRDIRELMTNDSFPNAWQKKIIDMVDVFEIRKVDVIIDTIGGKGKSSLVRYLGCLGKAKKIPFANDYKDLMRMVMDMPTQSMYFVDMPRAIGKERLYQLYGAIEEIKSGYAFDDRYSFKDKYFDPPRVVVITNTKPDLKLLSSDRWNLWSIVNDDLVPFSELEARDEA